MNWLDYHPYSCNGATAVTPPELTVTLGTYTGSTIVLSNGETVTKSFTRHTLTSPTCDDFVDSDWEYMIVPSDAESGIPDI